jgi:hypothetical protein
VENNNKHKADFYFNGKILKANLIMKLKLKKLDSSGNVSTFIVRY